MPVLPKTVNVNLQKLPDSWGCWLILLKRQKISCHLFNMQAIYIDEILVFQRFTTSFKEKFIGLCKSVDNAIVCHNILPYLRENQNDSDGNCQKLRELLGRWIRFRVLALL